MIVSASKDDAGIIANVLLRYVNIIIHMSITCTVSVYGRYYGECGFDNSDSLIIFSDYSADYRDYKLFALKGGEQSYGYC